MCPPAVCDVALIVAVAHQCADVPTDLVADSPKASHCFCTSFSTGVANSRDGPKIRDGNGVSTASGRPRPRIERIAITTAAATTISTTVAKMIDSVPWMNVLRMTACSWSGSLAAPNDALPASRASRYWKCWV